MERSLSQRLRHLSFALVIGVSGAALLAAGQGRSDEAPGLGAGGDAQFVPNEVLVQFVRGAGEADQAEARRRVGGRPEEVILAAADREDGKGDLELMALPPGLSVANAMARLHSHAAVEFAEPNWVYYHQATSNDPGYTNGSLWGMYGGGTSPANQFGSQAGEAWTLGKTGSAEVYVGIIDEGFMYTHADLARNTGNPNEIAGNRVDDDGNGYVDDVYGWDFDGHNNTVFDGTQDDHGTHVAGTIGAVGGNGIGVAGVNWNVRLLDAKFLGRRGGTTANAIKAVDYFTNLKTRGLNLVATNNSWSGGGYSKGLYDAIERACNANLLFVAAAGNGGADGVGDNIDAAPSYPASYPNSCIVAVAAITSTGARAGYSNYGATSVDIGAPGSGIYSTLPASNGASTYGSYSGTSMATPHVTGAAALYASLHPAASAQEIKAAILSAAVPTASLAGRSVSGGRLNVSGF